MTDMTPTLEELRLGVPRQRPGAADSAEGGIAEGSTNLSASEGLLLTVLARAEVNDDVPALAGFIASSFSPLIAEAAARCLTQAGKIAQIPGNSEILDRSGVPDERGGRRTGIVIVSASGDVATALSVAQAVDAGARLGPLLFFQAVPNAVAGYVAARWGLTGPVVCLSPAEDALAEGYAIAELLISDGDADEALIIVAEQSDLDGERDHALAVLVCDASKTKGVQP